LSRPQPHPINEQTSKLTRRSGFSIAVLRRELAVLDGAMLAIAGMAIPPAPIAKNQTIRQIVRVRLSHVYGADPLLVGAAHVSLRSTGTATEHSEGLTTYVSAEGDFSGARAAAKQGCTSSDAWDKARFDHREQVLEVKPHYEAVGDTA